MIGKVTLRVATVSRRMIGRGHDEGRCRGRQHIRPATSSSSTSPLESPGIYSKDIPAAAYGYVFAGTGYDGHWAQPGA
jgi:hypothetical protein